LQPSDSSSLARAFTAWPNVWSFPQSFGGAHGVLPFAGLLPHRVDSHLCDSGPTCRSRHSPDPIDFRRADRARRIGIVIEPERASGSGVCGVRLLGFAPVCGPRPRLSLPRDTILPWALPLAGLSDTTSCIRPGSTPATRIIGPRPLPTSRQRANPLMGLGDPSRSLRRVGGCHHFARRG